MKIFISSVLLGSHDMRERKTSSSTASAKSDCRFLVLFKRRRNARKRYDSRFRTGRSLVFFVFRARDTVAAASSSRLAAIAGSTSSLSACWIARRLTCSAAQSTGGLIGRPCRSIGLTCNATILTCLTGHTNSRPRYILATRSETCKPPQRPSAPFNMAEYQRRQNLNLFWPLFSKFEILPFRIGKATPSVLEFRSPINAGLGFRSRQSGSSGLLRTHRQSLSSARSH